MSAIEEILVVEDDLFISEFISGVLSKDYLVSVVDNATAGLERLHSKNHNFICIIIDLNLPGISGLDLLKSIKSNKHLNNIPIILETGSQFDQSISSVIEKGWCYYLQKPFTIEYLTALVSGAVQLYRRQLDLIKNSVHNYKEYTSENAFNQNSNSHRKNVLIIDENVNDIKSIGNYLKNTNFNFHSLNHINEETYEKIKQIDPDCVLLDYKLANENSLSILKQLKNHGIDVATIVLTSTKSSLNANESLKSSVDDFLIKNEITSSSLYKSIQSAILNVNLQKTVFGLTFHDSLTDLPNRKSMLNKLVSLIDYSKTNNQCFAVMLLDLDKFKSVNDMYGHNIGDELLVQFTNKIKLDILRPNDMFGRLTGDEFIILATNIKSPSNALRIAEKIEKVFIEPICIDPYELNIGISIGISIFPDDGMSSDSLLRKSDIAMYQVKKELNTSYMLFNEELSKDALKQIKLELDIKKALRNNEFRLVYQPKYNQQKVMIGAEVLIRWNHSTSGNIPPSLFIPIIENSPLIIDIGKWVINKVCQQIRKWLDLKHLVKPISINLSPAQLLDNRIIDTIKESFESNHINPNYLEFEVTESAIMKNIEKSILILNQISKNGIRIALDDFGTGYSSLNKLVKLPVDVLKIDKSFIDNLPEEEGSKVVATTIIDLANKLGVEVVAEGVETHKQFKFLTEHNCRIFQGYFFNKPLEIKQFEALLK